MCALDTDPAPYTGLWTDDLYERLDKNQPDLRVLTKLLVHTLRGILAEHNFTGVVVTWKGQYDFVALKRMVCNRVPIYVSFPLDGSNPYLKLHQHHHLKDFFPTHQAVELALQAANNLAMSPLPAAEPLFASTPTAAPPAIRYGVRPNMKTAQKFKHPMDYVASRLEAIPERFRNATPRKQQSMESRRQLAKSFKYFGSAELYLFTAVTSVDEKTGQETELWTREKVATRADAESEFEDLEPRHLWYVVCILSVFPPPPNHSSRYDFVANQWNWSDQFNFDNPPRVDQELDVDELFEIEALRSFEDGEIMNDPNEPPPPERNAVGDIFDWVLQRSTFNSEVFRNVLIDNQYSVGFELLDRWNDEEDFLWKRYGLRPINDMESPGAERGFSKRLGLNSEPPYQCAVDLFHAAVDRREGLEPPSLPREFDFSPEHELLDDELDLPLPFPNTIKIINSREHYYISTGQPWMIHIDDPLTILQIKREKWHLQPEGLVLNLVRKGVPFEILNPSCESGTVLTPHQGPVYHPNGQQPNMNDYLSYRLDVARLFTDYPHVHAAALCRGGILWRIAVDVLPLPTQDVLVGPFHQQACNAERINDQMYWSPTLTEMEEFVIVGVHLWSRKSNQEKE